jgi:hypothetical protein
MKAKKITTLLLLLFVVASIGTIVAKERIAQVSTTATELETIGPSNTEPPFAPVPSEKAAPVKVVAYYFHGNRRCVTCRTIEALTTEAIETGFADDIKTGRVELKVVNVEEPGNEHFIRDYELVSRSVVVARYEDGQQRNWKRLDEVWQLVRDKEAFIRFMQEQTSNLLKGQPS